MFHNGNFCLLLLLLHSFFIHQFPSTFFLFFSYCPFSILNVCRASIVMSEFNDCDFCFLSYFILLYCLLFVCDLSSCPVFWADVIV